MFAVVVDVSNGRSTVAVLGAKRKAVMKPFEVSHTADGFPEKPSFISFTAIQRNSFSMKFLAALRQVSHS